MLMDTRSLRNIFRTYGKAAVPVAGRCAWSVEFHPMLEGVYTFDATLIDWKGLLEADTSKYGAAIANS